MFLRTKSKCLQAEAQLFEPIGRVLRLACTLNICDAVLRNSYVTYVAKEPNCQTSGVPRTSFLKLQFISNIVEFFAAIYMRNKIQMRG